MDVKRCKIYLWISMIIVMITGVIFHFLFDWTGKNLFVGLFCPINESTWEHMKLAFFPMLIVTNFLNNRCNGIYPNSEGILCVGTLAATWNIPMMFYFYRGALGFGFMAVDLAIYFISVFVGYAFMNHLINYCGKKRKKIFTYGMRALVLLQALAFFAFTYFSPAFPIFIEPEM